MRSLELVERIQSGKNADSAQEELYRRVRHHLLDRLRERIPPRLKPRLDAEDVLHEAFLRAMAALDRFQARSSRAFYGWFYSIAKNLIANAADRRSALAVRLESGVLRQRGATTEFASLDWVESMLGRLKEKEAEVIRLRLLREMSFESIAASWDMTPGAVQRFYSRSCQRLRRFAHDACKDPD